MVLDTNVPGDVLEILKQNLWLRDFISSLGKASIAGVGRSSSRECITHIGIHSWNRLSLETRGTRTIRPKDETSDEIRSLVRHFVVYKKDRGKKILRKGCILRENGLDHLPSPQAIIDNLEKTRSTKRKFVQILGVVEFGSIFRLNEVRYPFTLTVYPKKI